MAFIVDTVHTKLSLFWVANFFYVVPEHTVNVFLHSIFPHTFPAYVQFANIENTLSSECILAAWQSRNYGVLEGVACFSGCFLLPNDFQLTVSFQVLTVVNTVMFFCVVTLCGLTGRY